MRRPVKTEALNKLREIGVPVGSVIDVGVLAGTPQLMTAFGDKTHLLIEPVIEYGAGIHAVYGKMGIDHELVAVAAADRNGEMDLEVSSVIAGQPITHARLTGGKKGKNIRRVPVRTIESLLATRSLAKPYYLKIDVDGAEAAILAGAGAVLPDCSVIEVEAVLDSFQTRTAPIFAAGFELFDIVDPCYHGGRLAEVDLVFLNKKTIRAHRLGLFQNGFDVGTWEAYK